MHSLAKIKNHNWF